MEFGYRTCQKHGWAGVLRLTSTLRVELGPIARGQASAYAGAIAGAGGSAAR